MLMIHAWNVMGMQCLAVNSIKTLVYRKIQEASSQTSCSKQGQR